MNSPSKLLLTVLTVGGLLALVARPALATTPSPDAGQAPPPAPAQPTSPPPPPAAIQKWEIFCLSKEKAGVEQDWANDDLDKKDGWNPVLKRYGAQGWEPVQFIYHPGSSAPFIKAVCFKRPLPG